MGELRNLFQSVSLDAIREAEPPSPTETTSSDTSGAKVSGVSRRRIDDTFETFELAKNPEMRAAYDRCKAVGEGRAWCAFLAGKPGNGKTHLAIAAMHEYGITRSYFWKVPEFLDWIRAVAYGEKVGIFGVLKSYVSQDFLLVLDDLGTERHVNRDGADFADEQLYRVLDARYENELPTIITTNRDLDYLDPRLLSRYAEGMVACKGVDLRRTGAASQ